MKLATASLAASTACMPNTQATVTQTHLFSVTSLQPFVMLYIHQYCTKVLCMHFNLLHNDVKTT